MAWTLNENGVTMQPAEDLSYDQYKFVSQVDNGVTGGYGTGANTVVKSKFGDYPMGIVANEPSGAKSGIGTTGPEGYQVAANVITNGFTKVVVDAAYDPGTVVYAGLTGTLAGYATQATGGNLKYARGILREGSVQLNDVVTVQLIDNNPA